MLEHATERDDFPSSFIDTVTDDLVGGIISRGDIGQGTVFGSLFHTYFLNIKAVIHLEVIPHMRHVEGIETGLRLRERRLHLRGLQHLCRMIGRHAEGLSAIHDILTQSEGE